MDELEINPQIIYYDQRNGMGAAMTMLTFGFRQFATSYRYQNLGTLKAISEADATKTPEFSEISAFAFNQLMDSIKITICFENFIKSLLVANRFIIHKLNKIEFPELNSEQYTSPITVDKIRAINDFEINPKIKAPDDRLKYQLKGLEKFTVGMKELLKPNYLEAIKIDPKIIEICKPFFDYRNNLHFYTGESISFHKSDYDNFIKVIKFLNANLVRIQNEIVDHLKKGEEYKLKKLPY